MTTGNRIQLVSESTRLVKQLQDFKPSHKVPKEINAATSKFVKSCAAGDITVELESIWNQCKEEFNYKRKDKTGLLIENGMGVLVLPDFRYNISVEQEKENPGLANWKRSVNEIKDLSIILDPRFNAVFSKSFDTLESDFLAPQNVEALIDKIEDLESPRITVKYPVDSSFCEVFIKDLGISISVNRSSYRICLPNSPTPKALLERVFEFQKALQSEWTDSDFLTLV